MPLQNQNEVQRDFHPSYHTQTPLLALSLLLHGIRVQTVSSSVHSFFLGEHTTIQLYSIHTFITSVEPTFSTKINTFTQYFTPDH